LRVACSDRVGFAADALGIEVLALGVYWLARFAWFIRLFTRVQPRDRAAPGSLWLWEWLLWIAWVVALVGGGVLLVGSDPRAFYVLAVWAVSGFVLTVWNAWVLMSEVGNGTVFSLPIVLRVRRAGRARFIRRLISIDLD